MSDCEKSGFGALLLGIGVGVGLGLLFAPRAGEETRELIAEKARDGMACASDAVDELRMQVETGLQNAGDAVQQMKERMEDTVSDAREKLHEAVEAGQDAYRSELRQRKTDLDTPLARPVRSVS